MKLKLTISLFVLAMLLMPAAVSAQDACGTTCPAGQKVWINVACQQRKLLGVSETCCQYYCGTAPDDRSYNSSDAVAYRLDLDKFDSSLELSTPRGIATLITVGLQMFLGVVALYAVYTAVSSALAIAGPKSSDELEKAKKRMSGAIGGIIICGSGIIVLQFLINFLGLGSIGQIFNSIAPFLTGGGGQLPS